MFRKHFKFSFVAMICGLVLAGCHSSAKQEAMESVAKKDTVKPVAKAETPQGPFPSFVILDTIVGRDTIKFVMYDDSLARCSVNNLSDICNTGGHFEHWDSSFGDYGLMMVPGKKKLQKFILNDSLLIIPVSYGFMRMSGGVALYLLNRTKHSLKFAPVNDDNPCRNGSECPYVDIKTNQIIDYYYHEILNDEDAGNGGEEHGRYMTFRSRIKNKQFVQTDEAAVSSPQIEKIELFDPGDSDLRAFYSILAQHEDWERERYDSANIQRIVAIDTTVGNAKIKVWYDNQGNLICTLNGKCDSTDLDENWMGYEWWRKKAAKRIIIPGEKNPRALILNDSLLLFTLVNSDGKAVLFLFDRRKTNLDSNIINTFANYIYVDLKRNIILSYSDTVYGVDLRDDAKDMEMHTKNTSYLIKRYSISKQDMVEGIGYWCLFSKKYAEVPSTYENSRDFYNAIAQNKIWKQGINPTIVNDFLRKLIYKAYF